MKAGAATATRLGINVLGGLHDGAVLDFEEAAIRRLGSGADADILLLDEGVAAEQCLLQWGGADVLLLEALAVGMEAYGRDIEVGTSLSLPVGAVVTLSVARLMVVRLDEAVGASREPVAQPASAAEQAGARRRVLRQQNAFLYLRDLLRPRAIVLWVTGGILVVGLAAIAGVEWLSAAPTAEQLRVEAAAKIHSLFPAVTVRAGSGSDTTIYEGYVRDERELNQLRSIALGVNSARTVIRVVPMDVLQYNATMWLDTYYSDPLVEMHAPGRLTVVVGSELAIRSLQGWDFAGVARQLQATLPELASVVVKLADPNGGDIAIPAAQMGVSFVPTGDGSAYVVDAQGATLFSGAVTKEGRVDGITNCSLRLHSRTTGLTYRVMSGISGCNHKDIAPEPSSAPIDLDRGNTPR